MKNFRDQHVSRHFFKHKNNSSHVNLSWWARRTLMEQYLLITLLIIIAVNATIFLVYLLTIRNRPPQSLEKDTITLKNVEEPNENICSTPQCIHTASDVLKFIDPSVDPCENFYEFSCGTFLKDTLIPDDKASISPSSIIKDNLDQQLRTVIEESASPKDTNPFKLLRLFYNTCMSSRPTSTYTKRILRELGGWPVLRGYQWNEAAFDWKNFSYKARKLGLNHGVFINVNVEIDQRNSSKRIIVLDKPLLGFDQQPFVYGFKDERVESHYDYMVNLAVRFGADQISAEHEMKRALQFEIDLSMSQMNGQSINQSGNHMSILQLQRMYPDIPWLEYINNIINIPDLTITDEEVIYVKANLATLVDLLISTPKRIQANYAMFKVVNSLLLFLPKTMRNRTQQYPGRKETLPRWQECTQKVTKYFDLAAQALYVRKFFTKETKSSVVKLVSKIHQEGYKALEEIQWPDNYTKFEALDKIKSMRFHIAYTDDLLSNEKLQKHYSKLRISYKDNNYLRLLLKLERFRYDQLFYQLRTPVDETKYQARTAPTHVNAFYESEGNKIHLPVGILQGVFFNNDRPHYMNYGGLGYLVGHEIVHGMYVIGRKYDGEGPGQFILKTKCLTEQYGKVIDPDTKLKLNGKNTLDENIADNGGIKLAYFAYRDWVEENSPELLLPGLNYTQNQMFWISAAMTWCTKTKRSSLEHCILNGIHSPARFRVQVPFGNMQSFAEDFNCDVGSEMNPTEKCRVL